MIHADRWLTLHFFERLRRLGLYKPRPGIPILMYHSISDDPEPGVHPYYRLNTSPSRFREQMQWLHDKGYAVLELTKALDNLEVGLVPHNAVVLTFDDGFRDFYVNAWPVIQHFGYPCTVFLATGLIDAGAFKSRACLSWEEVRRLSREGVCFGSHTVTHRKLVDLDWNDIRAEIRKSRIRLEKELEERVVTFSYPHAYPSARREFCARLSALLAECQYNVCVTTRVGRQTPRDTRCAARRIPVSQADLKRLFLAKLSGSYDWLAFYQELRKTMQIFSLQGDQACKN